MNDLLKGLSSFTCDCGKTIKVKNGQPTVSACPKCGRVVSEESVKTDMAALLKELRDSYGRR